MKDCLKLIGRSWTYFTYRSSFPGYFEENGDAGGGLSANPRRHLRNWASPCRWAIIFFDRPVKAPYIRSFSRHDLWIDTQSESSGANTNHAVVMARVSHDV